VGNLLDSHLPGPAGRRFTIDAAASREQVWEALQAFRPADALAVRLLFSLRMMRWVRGPVLPFAEGLRRAGFQVVAEKRPEEWVVGAAGRFWTPSGRIIRLASAAEFDAYQEPGAAKAAMGFRLESLGPRHTRLTTETRVSCFGPEAERSFGVYWRAVAPWSALLRRVMLRAVKADAERRASAVLAA